MFFNKFSYWPHVFKNFGNEIIGYFFSDVCFVGYCVYDHLDYTMKALHLKDFSNKFLKIFIKDSKIIVIHCFFCRHYS